MYEQPSSYIQKSDFLASQLIELVQIGINKLVFQKLGLAIVQPTWQ